MNTNDSFIFILLLLALAVLALISVMFAVIFYLQLRKQNEKFESLQKMIQKLLVTNPPTALKTHTTPIQEVDEPKSNNNDHHKNSSKLAYPKSLEVPETFDSLIRVEDLMENAGLPSVRAEENSKKSQIYTDAESPRLEITPEFRRGLELMSGDSHCIFITGKAGAGKSELLKYFVKSTPKSVVLLAPTGMAALRINGQTIHSFFRFPARTLTDKDIKTSDKAEIYNALDAIIIDEISMVRVDLLDRMDQFLRRNGRDEAKPFGGTQMIFFGDLYQLPPIVRKKEETQYIASNYKSRFFFDAHVFENLNMEKLELTHIFRQKDDKFVKALNAVRTNMADRATLEYLNTRCIPAGSIGRSRSFSIVTTNKAANRINKSELSKLSHKPYTYKGELEGKFADMEEEDLPVDVELTLKVGAQVIFVKNDMQKRWLNGDRGKILELDDHYIRVEMEREGQRFEYVVDQDTWEIINYSFDYATRKIIPEVVGRYIQYPLKLGWAITIHKSQGATMDRVHVDFGSGTFESGQAYVALSRCKSIEGLSLERPLGLADIKCDSSVIQFMNIAFPGNIGATGVASNTLNPETQYGYQRIEGSNSLLDGTQNMVLPLFSDPSRGLNLGKYRGDCKVYLHGKFQGVFRITGLPSLQKLKLRFESWNGVTVEPMDLHRTTQLHNP